MTFLRRIEVHVPRTTTLLVDVSNVTHEQMESILKAGYVPTLLSTQKSFNYQSRRGVLPPVPPGTKWIVLRVPHARDDGRTHTTHFDVTRQIFEARRSKTASPRLRYLPESNCTIDSADGRPLTKPQHSSCEIDDLTLAHLSHALSIPVATNDRGLHRNLQSPKPIPRAMKVLMNATAWTVLTKTKRGWSEK